MGVIGNIIGTPRGSTPSSPSNGGSGLVHSIVSGNYKAAAPAPTTQPRPVIQQPIQQSAPQNTSLISKITSGVGNAIGAAKNFIDTTFFKDPVVHSPISGGNTTPVNKSPVNLLKQATKTEYPQTVQSIKDIVSDPLSKKADPKKIINDAWEALKVPMQQESQRIAQVFNKNAGTPSQKIGQGLSAISGAGSVAFSPISALFSAANDVPVLGTISKLVTVPFSFFGEGAPKVSNAIIDHLPISQQAKDNIKPGLGEIFALASQLALGKLTDIGPKKIEELQGKYGVEDTKTIVKKATELSQDVKTEHKYLTPQEVRNEVLHSDLKDTPAGNTLMKASIEAARNNKDIKVAALMKKTEDATNNFIAERKGKVTPELNKRIKESVKNFTTEQNGKNTTLKTPGGNEFTYKLVDKTESQIMKQTEGMQKNFTSPDINKELNTDTTKESTIKGDQSSTTLPEKGVSKIGSSIETKAIENRLTNGFEGVAGYDKITIKDQAKRAADVMTNIDEARSIIKGEKPLPEGLRGTALILAAEEHIAKTGDAQLAHDLANSPLVSETSTAAQEMRLAAERNPDSLTLKLQELKKVREDQFKKRYGDKSSKEFVKKSVEDIKKQVKRPDKHDWGNFINSLQC